MIKYELLNLYLGKSPPAAPIIIGPYSVSPVSNYANAIESLYRPRHRPHPIEIQFSKILSSPKPKTLRKKHGKWVKTACARLQTSPEGPAMLVERAGKTKEIWDLCIILSFITGMRVCLHNQRFGYNPNHCREGICKPSEALYAAGRAWQQRKAFASDVNLIRALYALLNSQSIDDAIAKSILVNTAFNCLMLHAPKQKKSAQYMKMVKAYIKQALKELKSYPELVGSSEIVRANLNNALSRVSYDQQMIYFLISAKVLDQKDITKDVAKRVMFINTLRNVATHSHTWPILDGYDRDQSMIISASLTVELIPAIVRWYICMQFGIADYMDISESIRNLKNYLITGNSWGYRIEKESMLQANRRLAKARRAGIII